MEKFSPSSIHEWLQYSELERNIIRYYTDIADFAVMRLFQQIDYLLDKETKPETIEIHLMSSGGEVYPALAVYDRFREIVSQGTSIVCIVEGYAASAAAAMFLQGASIRAAYPTSRFLLHEIGKWKSFILEKTSDMQDEYKEMNILSNHMYGLLAKRCGRTFDEVKNLIERREMWMSAQEAKQWGLIDEIIGDD